MRILQSRAEKLTFSALILLGAGAAVIGFCTALWAGIAITAIVTAMLVIIAVWSGRRHREIDKLTLYLNRVLHGEYALDNLGNEEGELKVLKSEIYKMTVRLREQADQLQQDKVYLADSIADISHQLRTPLTSMNLVLSLLTRGNTTPERQGELLRELTVLLHRMDSLIAALLKISKIDAGTAEFQQEPVSVYGVLQQAAETIAIPMELRGQTMEITGDPQASYLGDEMWSVEAIGNVLKNCMEHMPEGGRLTIAVEENVLYTQVIIEDNGKGIAKEDLPHIFERFYRGKNADSGSFGIGLALSRMIITRQNGTIKAANRKEGGSRFIIRFYKGAV